MTLLAFIENISLVAALLFANYVLAAICAIREVSAGRTSQGSIAWLVALAFLPFPTAFIYLVFGWKHFDSYAKTKMEVRGGRLIRSEELAVIDRDTGKDWPVQLRAAGMPFLAGNRTELLVGCEATFESIFEGIATARHYVFVQFYIIRHDALGQRLAAVLMERARAGVAAGAAVLWGVVAGAADAAGSAIAITCLDETESPRPHASAPRTSGRGRSLRTIDCAGVTNI